MKKIMILGASILQLPAIKKAKEMGLQVIVADMNPEAVGFKEQGIIREIISTIDSEKILQAAKKYQIDGIMTLASDMPMRSVARVSKELGIIGITEETALRATDKTVMRQCLKNNNIPIPEFYKIANEAEYINAINIFKSKYMKCILKPADNSGSRGVTLLKDLSDEHAIKAAYEYTKQYARSGLLIIEEFMDGVEVSVESLSSNGKCYVISITDKLTTGEPYFVEMGHNEPSLLPIDIQKKIIDITQNAVRAIGIENGPSHTEIKITKEGPKIVEIGARLGGDNITSHLVPLSTGIDLVKACIQVALGEEVSLKPEFNKGAAIRYFQTREGIIKAISGIEKAQKSQGIKQVAIVHGIEEKVDEIRNSVDRVGFVIAQDETVEKAIQDCEIAMEKIVIEII
ncbi:ATP-grasp domain-containing protein [Coprococcus sp. AF21-14LB]|uniref:ATP-grasp domain-containing protein n=1 Tax=Coprococcus sp. AF21-14LB TaxID=2292231 RepID=UPI0018F24205|nr:ATP-grasp domain-containing protein [Coprococcus sp. AF21-14LB]